MRRTCSYASARISLRTLCRRRQRHQPVAPHAPPKAIASGNIRICEASSRSVGTRFATWACCAGVDVRFPGWALPIGAEVTGSAGVRAPDMATYIVVPNIAENSTQQPTAIQPEIRSIFRCVIGVPCWGIPAGPIMPHFRPGPALFKAEAKYDRIVPQMRDRCPLRRSLCNLDLRARAHSGLHTRDLSL